MRCVWYESVRFGAEQSPRGERETTGYEPLDLSRLSRWSDQSGENKKTETESAGCDRKGFKGSNRPGGNPGANGTFLWPTPIQMPP